MYSTEMNQKDFVCFGLLSWIYLCMYSTEMNQQLVDIVFKTLGVQNWVHVTCFGFVIVLFWICCFCHIMGDFLVLSFWQHLFKQFTHISCFVSLSNIFCLVYNLTMNRLTNEQSLQIVEFYYQNACSVRKVHSALVPFYGQFNWPATVRWYPTFYCSKCNSLTCMICSFTKTVVHATQHA